MKNIIINNSIFSDIFNKHMEKIGSGAIEFVEHCIIALLILVIGFKLIKYVIKISTAVFEKSKMDPTLESFLLSAIKIGLKVLLVFWAITEVGVAASSVFAIIGSGCIALGLSLQGSLSNIAGGVILLFIKPFKLGDYILEGASGNEGYVEAIGIMYTKLRTVDNRIILVPNGNLSSETITNINNRPYRQEDITVGIEYSESIKKVRNVLQEIIEEEEAVLREHPVDIFVNAFQDSCIDMRIRFWVDSSEYWPCRWRTLENIKEKFDENDISIPFNQLDVNVHKN